MLEWVGSTIVGRVVSGVAVALLVGVLEWIAEGVDNVFEGRPARELFFVMVFWPTVVNLV